MKNPLDHPFPLKTALLIAVAGGLFYGFANFLSGKYYLPGCSFSEMRPQVVLPMFLGFWVGPWAGFLCGCLGDMAGYLIGGKGILFAPHWSVANGLMGMIPGLAGYIHAKRVDSIQSFARLLILLLVAVIVPFGFSSAVTYARGALSLHAAVFSLFLPVVITDILWAFLLLPVLLRAFRLMVVRIEMRTILTVYYLVIFAVLATWLTMVVSMSQELHPTQLYSLGALTLLVLLVALVQVGVSTRKITAPVIALTGVARRVAEGDYSHLDDLREMGRRPDELGTLAGDFDHMVQAVVRREQALKKQVSELKIEIDRKKQHDDIDTITSTDYFKMLKRKAGELRHREPSGENQSA